MRCQIPGCKNKSIKKIRKDGIFLGVYVEDVNVSICGRHSPKEVENSLARSGEEKALTLQEVNPYNTLPKMLKNEQIDV